MLSTFLFSCQKESAIGLIVFFAISKGTVDGRDFLAIFAAKAITSRLFVGKLSATFTIDGLFPLEKILLKNKTAPAISSP